MGKIKLKLVEVFYGYRCNLSCKGCSSGSDIIKNYDNDPTLESILCSIENLSNHVIPDNIDLIGGELLLYWDRIELITAKIRQHFPTTNIGMVTNGLQLDKFKDRLIDLCKRNHPCTVDITDHFTLFSSDVVAKKYHKKLNTFLKNTHRAQIVTQLTKPIEFKSCYYITEQGKLKPYATNDPIGSYTNGCAMPYCHTLVDSKLYKCSWFVVLPNILASKGQSNDIDWDRYLNYQPLDLVNPTDESLLAFSNTQDQAISLCDMCSNKSSDGIIKIKENVLS